MAVSQRTILRNQMMNKRTMEISLDTPDELKTEIVEVHDMVASQ
jgi:hypothetical protein